jgi:hypothetical protein
MDCRTCQPTLIDLLHGELATDAAEEAQEHLKGCASCRGAFDKLSRGMRMAQGLPTMEPPQAVGARLMQLAEQHANAAAALRRAQVRKPPGAWQSLLEFVGRFAMARQVGMATIMLLIVAVGLWSLPQLERAPVVDGGTVVNPEPSGEAAPSTGVQPAEPLDLQVDLRAGRIRTKEEEESAAYGGAARTAAESAPEAELASAKDERASRYLGRAQGEPNTPLEKAKSASKPRRRTESKATGVELDTLAELEGHGRADKAAGAGPTVSARASAEEERAFPGSSAAAAAPTAAAPPPAITARPQRANDDLLDGALAGARSRDATAVQSRPAPEQAAAPTVTPAKRKASADGASDTTAAADCSTSLGRYQQIVDAAPDSAPAGEALLAMARCRSQRGERALARALLERAARNPYVASRAKALLAAQPSAATEETANPRPQ